ncbi:MAG TPA: lysylphosphatidylglycerol synthase transmembrane domain-containing protein, partial [Ilumatobacteraceae bacterium]
LSFIPQFSGAISLMGCVSHPLPFRPVLAEQFANNFTGLIGGTVATTALVIRFFQKQGLKVAVAVSSGVMNSVASSIVEVVLITLGLVFTSTQFVPTSIGGGDLEQVILIGIVVIGVGVTIAVLIPRLRAAVRRVVAPQLASARDNIRGILKDPHRALMIFGGNLCSQVAYALVIDAALHAYGASLPLLQIIVINSLASLLGGMAPVPGGMGVVEAGLIAGMTAAGIEQEIAVAATFTARLCTAYLPPIWGWVSLNWLRHHDYV